MTINNPGRGLKQTKGLLLSILALLVFLIITKMIHLVTDWLWFVEVEHETVFNVILSAKILTGTIFGLVFFLVSAASAAIAIRYSETPIFLDSVGGFPLPFRQIEKGTVTALAFAGIVVISLFAALNGSTQSDNILLFKNASEFGLEDPLFKRDIGFYVFRLPLLLYIDKWFNFVILVTALLSGLIYLLRGAFIFIPPRIWKISAAARIHLSVIIAMFFFWGIFGAWMDLNEILFVKRGVVFGPGYTDVTTQLWIIKLLMVLYATSGLAIIVYTFRPNWKIPAIAILTLIAVSFLGRGIYPSMVQKFQVIPNEVTAETPYIEQNIRFTRFAYGLNRIEEKEFPTEESLTIKDLEENNLTIKNIRLWDHSPLLQTFAQLQEMRTYYKFTDVDNDRYTMNGEYRQVMLSAREISYKALPSRTWVNEHLTYTHGYGAVMGPVNRISPEGLPEFFIKDIPPVSSESIRITRPEIYFGENSNDFVFVNTKTPEFDYPIGDKNVYNRYTGKGGVPLSLFKKLLFAARFGSLTMLLSKDITSESRIMYHRNVLERAAMIAPFARFDDDPYLVISPEGRMLWFVDGYTVTDRIPYSEPVPELGNYIRNSLKAVIDAYDGSINLYISDPDDPLLKTYAKIFPGVFKPMSNLPKELSSHIRYPAGMLAIQARMYKTYHMQDPRVFYNKEDLWAIPGKKTTGAQQAMEPYYTIMKLPDVPKEEFILLSPFTPSRKDNMSAWMAARSDAPNYGAVIVYKFPKQKLVYGPNQIEARIDQDAMISQQLSLWQQHGSTVIRGNLLAIPIEKSILYVEPLYLAAENGQLPELKRVIVAYGNQIAMEETLDEAIRNIFGGRTGKEIKESTKRAADVTEKSDREAVLEALSHFLKAEALLKDGNWGAFGEELKKTGDILKSFRKRQ